MGFLDSILGKKQQSAKPNPVRETLFGDVPLDRWLPDATNAQAIPWNLFVSAREKLATRNREAAAKCWHEVLAHPGLESRQYLQAWHFLRLHGYHPSAEVAKKVLGIVVEVGMPKGIDLLAAYSDHSARYYNFSGAGVVWEHPDDSLDSIVDELLTASREVVAKLGPWDGDRPPVPLQDQCRISFLTPCGLHFGQGPMSALANDPLAGAVLKLATVLMQALIAKTGKS